MKKEIEREAFYDVALFVFCLAALTQFWSQSLLLTGIFFVAWLFALKLWHKKEDFVIFVVAAIMGPFAEIISIYFGAWYYASPDFLGIPFWLPMLWGITGVMIRRIAVNAGRFFS